MLRNRKNLKGSGFHINEDLAKINQKLSYTDRVTCTNVDTAWIARYLCNGNQMEEDFKLIINLTLQNMNSCRLNLYV